MPATRAPRRPLALRLLTTSCVALLAACSSSDGNSTPAPAIDPALQADGRAFAVEEVGTFDEPWAMTFLPDGRLLVTEKGGTLKLVTRDGRAADITGLPEVAYGGQGGLGDVVAHPDFGSNALVYFSYAEAGDGDSRGAVVARARLQTDDSGGGTLAEPEVLWRQQPKVQGGGHYAHRIAFDDAGMLWISSGDRQKFDPAQDMDSNMGKIVRLNDDGSVPADNPFADQGGVAAQVWSLGHRNPLGIAFDADGQLWNVEMGPKGGDELNRVERGGNYGYPIVSNGVHYDGRPIPDHDTRPEFNAPAITWTPVISPSSMIIYSGDAFPDWQGDAFVGGLSAHALVRVEFDDEGAREAERLDLGARVREVEQGPEGTLWVLTDGPGGRLLRLAPPPPPTPAASEA